MTPNKLFLRGFIGIQDGCGRNELSLDLTNLRKGLIGIIGPNGKGKSTIIDNLHPYRLMPSRCEGKYSTSSFSFFDHIVPGKAQKILEWTAYDGRLLKSDLSFNSKTKKSDCFLFEFIDGNWEPFTTDDGAIVVDGKTDNYDRAIEYLLGSPELFFSSRFLAQSRKPLSNYGNADIKMLLSEMLSIDKFKAMSKRASEVTSLLVAELDKRQAEQIQLSQLRQSEEKMKLDLQAKDSVLDNLRVEKKRIEEAIVVSSNRLQTLNDSLKLNADKVQRASVIRSQLEKSEAELRQNQKSYENVKRERQVMIEQVKKQIDGFNKIVSQKAMVEEAVSQLSLQQQALSKSEEDLANVRAKLTEAIAIKHRETVLQSELQNVQTSGAACRSNLETIWLQTKVIDEVPCAGMQMNSQCRLLSVAHEAKSKVPDIQSELEKFKSSYRKQKLELDDLVLKNVDHQQLDHALKLGEDQIKVLRNKVFELTNLTSKMNQITAAEVDLIASTELLEKLEKQLIEELDRFSMHAKRIECEINAFLEELKTYETQDLTQSILSAQSQHQSLRSQLVSLESQYEVEIRSHTTLSIEIEQLKVKLSFEPKLLAAINMLSKEIAYWKQLTIGFGNNGLIALCIDDAGPTLSDLVNQLLDCYGSQYSIEIRTQITAGNGAVKEGFEIIVHDSHKDSIKKLDFMSGGQKVYINDCLCRGIALYLGLSGTNSCRTLFSDETDGALDIERKRQFMKMKHRLLELSGCDREFFISHTPDCVDLADDIIDLSLV